LESQLPLARAFRYNNNRDEAYHDEEKANELYEIVELS